MLLKRFYYLQFTWIASVKEGIESQKQFAKEQDFGNVP